MGLLKTGTVILIPLLAYLWIAFVSHFRFELGQSHVVTGDAACVGVVRDDGIVKIYTEEFDKGGMLCLGYYHAGMRLFQMEKLRRLGAGRLTEIFGEAPIEIDKMMRRLNLYAQAKEFEHKLKTEPRSLDSVKGASYDHLYYYLQGIQMSYTHLKHRPLEFAILGIEIKEWTIADLVVIFRTMEFILAYNYAQELQREFISEHIGEDFAELINPFTPENFADYAKIPTINQEELEKMGYAREKPHKYVKPDHKEPENHSLSKAVLDEKALESVLGFNIIAGSQCFAISGKHTASGKPILVNDPHLANGIPPSWFMSEIHETKKENPINVIGAGIPGIPLYISGRNDHMAWGITAAHSDTADLYWEIVKDDKYYFDGKWRQLKVTKEKFFIKG